MNITSILITIAGIIFIIALYLMSRITQSKLPKNKITLLPDIKDEKGSKFTSVLDDIPASDGSTPYSKQNVNEPLVDDATSTKQSPVTSNKETSTKKNQQLVLFISSKDDNGLDGNLVKQSLLNNGLVFGENDIFHYLDESSNNNKISLFRIANGVEPWTLKEQDLLNKKLVGLSIIMLIPTKINDQEAVKILIDTAEKIANDISGVLKNQQQQILTKKDKELLIKK